MPKWNKSTLRVSRYAPPRFCPPFSAFGRSHPPTNFDHVYHFIQILLGPISKAPHFQHVDDLFAPPKLTKSIISFRSCWVPFWTSNGTALLIFIRISHIFVKDFLKFCIVHKLIRDVLHLLLMYMHSRDDHWWVSVFKQQYHFYSISQEICTRFCCASLCCGYAIVHNEFTWSIYPYSSGLLCWHWGNR